MIRINTVILSYAATKKHYELTSSCIKSLNASVGDIKPNICVVETNKNLFLEEFTQHPGNVYNHPGNAVVYMPDEPFNYNRFTNLGIERVEKAFGETEHTLLINNDIVFEPTCLQELVKAFGIDKTVTSLSPYTKNWWTHAEFKDMKGLILGNRRSWELTGWALLFRTKSLKELLPLDTNFSFHHQDDDLRLCMIKKGHKHGLVREAEITHFCSQSHELIPEDKKYKFLHEGANILMKKWK